MGSPVTGQHPLSDARLQRLLELARRHLRMDVAAVSEFTGGRQVYRALLGDASSFGMRLGDGPVLEDTYCDMVVQDRLPSVVPDSAREPRVRHLRTTLEARIGSYVGVPLRFADGTLYGTVCCVSHDARPLTDGDSAVLRLLADLFVDEVEQQRVWDDSHAVIRDLVSDRSIDMALQPVVALADGRCWGVEALARFAGHIGPPDHAFATARAVGLDVDLERLAVQRAMEVLPLLPASVLLAVNLSPRAAHALADPAVTWDDHALERIVLELTENAPVDSYAGLRARLQPVRERGLRLAIDDAGAGYASLQHIVELSPDVIKIDRKLIDGVAGDGGRRAAVAAMITLGRQLGAVVVGEGVEGLADLQVLVDLGVDAAQGYLLARPSTDRADLRRWCGAEDLRPQPAEGLDCRSA